MLKVTVYGSGDSKCKQMRIRVHNALWMLGLREFQIEVEGDMRKFPEGVTEVPSLSIEDKILVDGRLPELAELQRILAPFAFRKTEHQVA